MRLKACFQYLIVVCVVMTIYSAVLLHLSKSVKTSNQNAGGPPLVRHINGVEYKQWNALVHYLPTAAALVVASPVFITLSAML